MIQAYKYGSFFVHANAAMSRSESDSQWVHEIPHYYKLVEISTLPSDATCGRCLQPVSQEHPDCKDLLFRAGDRVSVNGIPGTVADDGKGNAMTESGSVWVKWDKAQMIGSRVYNAEGEWVEADEVDNL